MPYRQEEETTQHVLAKLFAIAKDKLKDEDSKEVMENLEKAVLLTSKDLTRPKPRFLDAMFFPNEKNVERLV